jgi:hypothetical protein
VYGDSNQSEKDSQSFQLKLKYLGKARLELRGSSTGEVYQFSSDVPVQPVDLRDARFLLASPLFTIV